jgi:15-cis-phytoene synthase
MTHKNPATDNAAYCAELVRSHDFARYAATLFLPAPSRRPVLALYAFNVELSRIRDHITQPLPGEVRLQWWRDLIESEARGSAEANPVAAELLAAIALHDLPREQLSRFVDARVFDLYDDPMPSLDTLERYCGDIASRLFVLTARILGETSEEVEHVAHHAGIAQGLADVIAALPLHASRGQLYLPKDVLEQSGAEEADIFAGRPTAALQAAIDRLIGEAQSELDSASDLLCSIPEQASRAFIMLALVQRALHGFGRPDANPFVPSPPSHLRVLWTLWRASKARCFKG